MLIHVINSVGHCNPLMFSLDCFAVVVGGCAGGLFMITIATVLLCWLFGFGCCASGCGLRCWWLLLLRGFVVTSICVAVDFACLIVYCLAERVCRVWATWCWGLRCRLVCCVLVL